jgi:tripartite-type tricarboxylate transporter receptor subunit TctC
MLSRRAAVGLIGSLLTPVNVLAGEIWPQRTIRVITPAQPGGSPDVVARLYADALARKLGQAVVVENRPGADGILAIQALLEAASGDPNHVFLVAPTTISTVLPALKEKLPFDAAQDIQPLCTTAADFLAIAVPETSSLRSMADVVQLSKRSPGTLNWFAVPGAPFLLMSHWVKALELPMV